MAKRRYTRRIRDISDIRCNVMPCLEDGHYTGLAIFEREARARDAAVFASFGADYAASVKLQSWQDHSSGERWREREREKRMFCGAQVDIFAIDIPIENQQHDLVSCGLYWIEAALQMVRHVRLYNSLAEFSLQNIDVQRSRRHLAMALYLRSQRAVIQLKTVSTETTAKTASLDDGNITDQSKPSDSSTTHLDFDVAMFDEAVGDDMDLLDIPGPGAYLEKNAGLNLDTTHAGAVQTSLLEHQPTTANLGAGDNSTRVGGSVRERKHCKVQDLSWQCFTGAHRKSMAQHVENAHGHTLSHDPEKPYEAKCFNCKMGFLSEKEKNTHSKWEEESARYARQRQPCSELMEHGSVCGILFKRPDR